MSDLSVDHGPAIQNKHRLRRVAAYTLPGGKDPRTLDWEDFVVTKQLVADRRQLHAFSKQMSPRQEKKRDGEREFTTLFFDKAPTLDDMMEIIIREAETSKGPLSGRIAQLKVACDEMDIAEGFLKARQVPAPVEALEQPAPEPEQNGKISHTVYLPRKPRARKPRVTQKG